MNRHIPGPLVDVAALPEWLRPLVERTADIDIEHFGRAHTSPPDGARKAAVLILFGQGSSGDGGAAEPDVLLLRRADELSSHPGQVAFPGGAVDAQDRDAVDAALREAVEEVGVLPSGIHPVATLPELYVPHSGFRVIPVLAYWREPSPVAPVDPAETAAVARVPISWLADPANRIHVSLNNGHKTPAFLVPGMLVWGFTGGLLSGVLDLAGWSRNWNRRDIRGLDEAWRAAEEADDVGFGR
ncbi:NUDIX domain-containing protein [Halopolyspora algeriensis]|uniref:NUDIX domain-containing protein n=1 Tax=Halopolyspora algeriensis TaxID=1500506 RepID=A0A368VMI2_9ACTN|nr:CoA pyrophosphatase [Halopolyspora algeriensis]RCW40230.1 NUDIX domain-containing protein [Halopolyspora algeriensis]TQM46289.1 NUDIX domain-containing protein [Halopolyspora algeriensis]